MLAFAVKNTNAYIKKIISLNNHFFLLKWCLRLIIVKKISKLSGVWSDVWSTTDVSVMFDFEIRNNVFFKKKWFKVDILLS